VEGDERGQDREEGGGGKKGWRSKEKEREARSVSTNLGSFLGVKFDASKEREERD